MWKRLNHHNLVPTLGASPEIAASLGAPKLSQLCAVSPWMPNGHLLQYLKKYPGANRVFIVRICVLHTG